MSVAANRFVLELSQFWSHGPPPPPPAPAPHNSPQAASTVHPVCGSEALPCLLASLSIGQGKKLMLQRVVLHGALEVVMRTAGSREEALRSSRCRRLGVVLARHACEAREPLRTVGLGIGRQVVAARARQGGENEDERFAHEDSKPGSARRSRIPRDAMSPEYSGTWATQGTQVDVGHYSGSGEC